MILTGPLAGQSVRVGREMSTGLRRNVVNKMGDETRMLGSRNPNIARGGVLMVAASCVHCGHAQTNRIAPSLDKPRHTATGRAFLVLSPTHLLHRELVNVKRFLEPWRPESPGMP